MSRDAILGRLFIRTTKGIKLGLERMAQAAEILGNPHRAFRVIHVAGTNGKGSVCACLDSVLRATGYRVGLYTSPHIVRFEERFIVDGHPVGEGEWMSVYADVEPIVERFELTFFEAATIICFELFRRRGVEWAVIEAGLGGRLDATNIVMPEVSVITALSVDHVEYLGSDIMSIAGEKLGIVKPGVPLVLSQPPEPEVLSRARAVCREAGSRLIMARRDEVKNVKRSVRGSRFTYGGRAFETPLRGTYQPLNALCALKALECMGVNDREAIVSGLSATKLPGRFQTVAVGEKRVVFDVGHNAQAAEALVDALEEVYSGRRICMVAGIMRDKDIGAILSSYSRCASVLVLTHPGTSRAATVDDLALWVPPDHSGPLIRVPSVAAAVREALRQDTDIVCVAGSFYTVGEAMSAVGIEPYGA